MWITSKGLCQESVVDPRTGLKKIVSVKVSGNGKKAEQDAYRRLEQKIEKMNDTRILLSKLIYEYLKDRENSTKPSTQRKVSIELEMFFQIYGECYVETINAGLVRHKLQASGKTNRTLNGYLKHFKAMWRWAYQNDYVKTTEVADKLKPFADAPEKVRIQDKYLEPWELNKLLEGMNEPRWVLLTRFLCLSGMRIGEVISLKTTDTWQKSIKVTKTYDSNNCIVTTPKSLASAREVFIQDELRDCINDINRYMKKQAEVCGYETDLFFPDTDGSYLSYQAYCKYLREVSERVLGRRIVPHTMRHTHASMLAAKGVGLESISSRLGHEDSGITKAIYLHRLEELKEKENKLLNSFRLIG